MADTAQPMVIIRMDSQLYNFERAAQVGVEAGLFRLAIQRSRAVDNRIAAVDQAAIFFIAQAKLRCAQIAAENMDARAQVALKFRKIEMQLYGAPQTHLGFMSVFRADQNTQRVAITFQQIRGHMGPDVSARSGQEK